MQSAWAVWASINAPPGRLTFPSRSNIPCHDHPLIMRAAWIIPLHFVEASSSRTHSASGRGAAGEPGNAISQVVPHELKIQEHGFPVRQAPPTSPGFREGGVAPLTRAGRKKAEKQIHDPQFLLVDPSPQRHAATVIQGCFHNVLPSNFCSACLREVWMRRLRHLAAAALAGCHEARDGATPPPAPEPFHKKGN